MKHFTSLITFLFLVALFMSCKENEPIQNKIIGHWDIKSIQQEKPFIGMEDISSELPFFILDIKQDNTLDIHSNGTVISGTWLLNQERYYNVGNGSAQNLTTPNYRIRLDLELNNNSNFPKLFYVDILNNSKLNMYSPISNGDIWIKSSK